MNNLYIIIVTYNAMNWLSQCLESCDGYSVIIVDNNSTDSTVAYLKANHTDKILLEQTENLGFGMANNIGISYAIKHNAEYVLLLNQDAYLKSNTIKILVETHKTNSQFGILSPIHLNGNGKKLDKNFSYYLTYEKNEMFYSDSILDNLTGIYDIPFVNAACWLLSKETINNIGGFDPIFFHYGEDENYCQRVLFHNYKIGIVSNAFVLHDRENRKTSNIDFEKKIINIEKSLKVKWANVNNKNFESEYNSKKNKLFKNITTSIIKFKFKSSKFYFKELQLIRKIKREINHSRLYNSKTGLNYLNNE